MIKIAICDDERECVRILEKYIAAYLNNKNIAYKIFKYNSGKELLELGGNITDCDVVFLDINMEEVDGIETAKKIRKISKKIHIVFVTAYISYSLEGYKVNALRYLLKNDINFKRQIFECMDEIIERINYVVDKKDFSFVGGNVEVQIDNIVYIESCAHRLIFYLLGYEKQEYSMYSKLGDIEQILRGYKFIRIHQSFLVNYNYIQSINENVVNLSIWNKELPVSRERYIEVKKRYILLKGEL